MFQKARVATENRTALMHQIAGGVRHLRAMEKGAYPNSVTNRYVEFFTCVVL